MSPDDAPRANRGQFKKGQSGNPGGRPRRVLQQSDSAFDVIIDKSLTVSRGGVPCEVTVEEALRHRTYQDALAGKRMAIREVLRWIVKREQWLSKKRPTALASYTWKEPAEDPNNADEALLLLGIVAENPARKDIKADRRQLLLEPWAVKAALKRRRGTQKLEKNEVDDVRRCTRADGTINFPVGLEP